VDIKSPITVPETEYLRRRVRIIDATHYPDRFLAEGIITFVNAGGTPWFTVKLTDGSTLTNVTLAEVKFL
jgi:hypothetical protein